MKRLSYALALVFVVTTMLLSACGGAPALSAPASTSGGGSKPQAMPVEFIGVIEAINGSEWTISGQTITVDPGAVRDGSYTVGDTVKVEVQVQADGSLVASRVELPSLDNSNDINSNDVNSNDINSNDTNSNDVNSNDVNSNDVNSNDVNSNDANSNDANSNDANSNDANSNDDDNANSNSSYDDHNDDNSSTGPIGNSDSSKNNDSHDDSSHDDSSHDDSHDDSDD